MSKRAQIIGLLVEGNSLRATARLADVTLNTARLLISAGEVCAEYHDEYVRGVKARCVQCDEIWAFLLLKSKKRCDSETPRPCLWRRVDMGCDRCR